jgi:hypothetical protein
VVVITRSGASEAPRTRPVACSILSYASRHSRAHLLTFWSVGIPVIVRPTISPLPQLAEMDFNQKLRYKDELFREVWSEAVHAPSEHEIFCAGNLVPTLSWLSLFIQNVARPAALGFRRTGLAPCTSQNATRGEPTLAMRPRWQMCSSVLLTLTRVRVRYWTERLRNAKSMVIPAAVFFEYGSFVRLHFSNNRSERAGMPN